MFKIGSKVVWNRNWYNPKLKEWLHYTTIVNIEKYDNELEYMNNSFKLPVEGLRLATKEEIETYYITE